MTIEDVKKLFNDYGIKPSKGKGQNFLIDNKVLDKIIAAANLDKEDYVLEIGPGFGVLTEQLLNRCQKLVSVELDKSLIFYLKRKFKKVENWTLLEGDILKIKNEELAERLGSEKYKLVANLPYAITKPILQKFLNWEPRPEEIVVLVQKEVAEKICAQPGDMGILSLSVQYYGRPEITSFVLAESFYPKPAVDSAILRITLSQTKLPAEISQILTDVERENFQEKRFWQLIKIGFSSPRKQLQNNLANGFNITKNEAQDKIKKAGLPELCRAQDLGLADWAKVYQQFVV